MRILLFEDHGRLTSSIIKGLAGHGFGVDAFPTADDGLNASKSITYDAIILDLGLPDRDGLDVLRELRESSSSIPILILTARDGIDDRVSGLDGGADDYVVKPFAMKELAARLRALLRRPGQTLGQVLLVGRLRLEVIARQVSVDGKNVHFSAREFQAVEMLMRHESQMVPKRSLEDRLYGLSKHAGKVPHAVEIGRQASIASGR